MCGAGVANSNDITVGDVLELLSALQDERRGSRRTERGSDGKNNDRLSPGGHMRSGMLTLELHIRTAQS